MASVTTYTNISIMKVARGPRNWRTNSCWYLKYSAVGKRVMAQVGKCLAQGGYVEFDMIDDKTANIKLFWK